MARGKKHSPEQVVNLWVVPIGMPTRCKPSLKKVSHDHGREGGGKNRQTQDRDPLAPELLEIELQLRQTAEMPACHAELPN